MNSYEDYRVSGRRTQGLFGNHRSIGARFGPAVLSLGMFIIALAMPRASAQFVVAPPKADLDQGRNGAGGSPDSPVVWVNGNVGSSNSHYVEGWSAPYRLKLTDMPTGVLIKVDLGYDIKHSDKHALDYLTQYQRLESHADFFHTAEIVNPTLGGAGPGDGDEFCEGTDPCSTFAIPVPSSSSPCASPDFPQPVTSFNALPAAERVFSLWGGTISAISYVSQGCLTDTQAETVIRIEFTLTHDTAVLAWGGHIGTRDDWGFTAGVPDSAGGISGSPYHMRKKDWFGDTDGDGDNDLPNFGNEDRSLSAGAVETFCVSDVCNDGIACTIDVCNEVTNSCSYTPDHSQCDDNNDCTDDVCVVGTGCVFTPDDSNTCKDPFFCNGNEQCLGGVCQTGSDPCNDGISCTIDACDEVNDSCSHTPDDSLCPDDGNPCSDAVCNPSTGCGHVCDDTNICNDGDYCNGIESCVNCVCTDGPDPCPDDGITCTNDFCDEVSDVCRCVPNDNACPDSTFCDGHDVCVCGVGCVDGPDPCAPPLSCDEPNDRCVGCINDSQCLDGLFCNGAEFCDPNTGTCQDGPDPCGSDGLDCTLDVCDEGANLTDNLGTCNHIADHSFCDDGNVCTNDVCDATTTPPSTGCIYTCNTSGCDDGIHCTINDQCSGTTPPCACTGTPRDCSYLNDQCNEGRCDPATGDCFRAPINEGQTCDDGLYCTCGDICLAGVCTPQASGADCCNDGIDCTNDSCDEVQDICINIANDTKCDDGVPCTVDSCDVSARACGHVCETPGITCPDDLVFECDEVGGFGNPVIDDDCSVNPVVECTEESTPGKLPQERTITRTCTITNDCGNSATCQQNIDIVDTTPPEVTCPPDCTLECGDVQCVPPLCADPSCECGGVATCEDNCSTCTVSVTCELVPKDCTAGQVAGLTPPPKLTVIRTYQSADGTAGVTATGEGNIGTCVQRIEIVDSIPPLLVDCPETITICRYAALSFPPPGCADACGTCSVICVRSDNLPFPGPSPSEPITVTCVASDECGNESSCTIDVELSDSGECFKVIPTMSEWGLVVLTLLLLTGAKVYFGRRQVAAA